MSPQQLKAMLVAYTSTHYLYNENMSREEYFQKYSKQSEWGGLNEIISFCQLFNVGINIYAGDKRSIPSDGIIEDLSIHGVIHPNLYDDGVLSLSANDVDTYAIFYHNDAHYDFLFTY
jgi:hypothetical protein